MAFLAILDHDGLSVAMGSSRAPLSPAGVALVAALTAAEPLGADGLAELADRWDEDAASLAELHDRLARWADAGTSRPRWSDRDRTPLLPPRIDDVDGDTIVQVSMPLALLAVDGGYLAWGPNQPDAFALTADEVIALAHFAMPRRVSAVALPTHLAQAERDELVAFLQREAGHGIVRTSLSFQPRIASARGENSLSSINDRTKTMVRKQAEILAARPPRNGRVPVFPVNRSPRTGPPLALGMLFAYAMQHEGGRLEQTYDFVPDWTIRPKAVSRLVADGPGLFLCSDYVWSIEENFDISRRVKELSPESLVVHGGPNAPKYEEDRLRFFAEHPEVDVIVHGEGELTVAELLSALDGDLTDLSVLADVPGLSYRPGPGLDPVTTADRPRIADLDTIPSPYTTGLFDAFTDGATELMILESNRGCPYGCTFCDWGSATLSRIRKFDMDRVRAEIEWAGKAGAKVVVMGDSNFGIFARDLEIAEAFVATKARYGAPEQVVFSYAKNTVKHVEKIVRTMVDGGIFGQAGISIQSFDEQTLEIINRKNIKTERYDELTRTFRESQLPVYTDLMVGLPGSTLGSLTHDLQQCIEREVMTRSYPTQLLTNSPMNAPEYRELHQIEVDEDDLLVSTASYTAEERAEMDRAVARFHAAESYGTLRQIDRWVHHRTGIPEIEVLDAIGEVADGDPERFPLTSWLLSRFLEYTIPPTTWPLLYDEVEQILRDLYGDALLDHEWTTVRAVQEALMPDRGRAFPCTIPLEHDYVAWSWRFSEARADHAEPAEVVPPLSDFPPADLVITDPNDVCVEQMGGWHWTADYHYWELGSPLARHLGGRWAPAH
jgi:hypothetical protein